MAGKGYAPKTTVTAPSRRSEKESVRVTRVKPKRQPTLDSALGKKNPMTDQAWLPASRRLWKALGEHPTTQRLVEAQWLSLARAVAADDAFLRGEVRLGSEARLRISKFFIDPDDVLRGRVHFVAEGDATAGDPHPEATAGAAPAAAEGIEQPNPDDDPRLSLVS